MKEKLKRPQVLERWFYTQSPLVITRPALKETGILLTYLAGSFLLSCGRVFDAPTPFALGLMAAAGGGLRGLCVLLGAVAGFLTMQPFSQGLEMTSAGILTFVVLYIFGSLWVTKRAWFRCLVPATMSAVVGVIFLLSREITMIAMVGYFRNVLLAGLSPLAFGSFLQGKRSSVGNLMVWCFLAVGCCALPLPGGMVLGTVLGAALTASAIRKGPRGTGGTAGAALGAALDLTMGTAGLWGLVLSVGGICGSSIPGRRIPLKLGLFAVGSFAVCAAFGGLTVSYTAPLILGLLLSLAIPGGIVSGREEGAVAESAALVEEQLSQGQMALKSLYDAIGIDPAERQEQENQQIFDKAAAKVCRRCAGYSQCWEKRGQETYRELRRAMGAILERGQAQREDFSEEFVSTCRHMDGLLVALNQELDGMAYRNQCRTRSEEQRVIVSRVLYHMARLLEENARQLRCDTPCPDEAFTLRIGVSAVGRRGGRLSGDRGLCFHTDDGRIFAILCDGAGTGDPAARESLLAVDDLAGLIRAGMAPENAMELLNGMYILRDSGGFATMDVFEVSLITGQGTLYKWGAAPSYLRSGGNVKKLGTAAPPPGLGMGSSWGPEVIRLSLWGGDMLVLLSDGVAGEKAEELIRNFEGRNVKALSEALVDMAEAAGGEDDMTAAVLRLEELRPR